MTLIAEQVASLLKEHDCVILPGLGGFVAQQRGSSFDQRKQTLQPPSKHIAFNSSLSLNDGLLANYISRTESKSYETALSDLLNDCVELRLNVYRGEKVEFNGIGILSLTSAGTIAFESSLKENLLLESYGLTHVHAQAVNHSELKETKIKQLVVETKHKKTNIRKFVSYTSAAAVLAALSFGVYTYREQLLNFQTSPDNQSTISLQQTSIIPFTDTYQYIKTIPLPDFKIKETPSNTSFDIVASVKTEVDTLSIFSHSKPVVPIESTEVSVKKFKLVAGVFKEEDNARKYLTDLKNKGIDATLEKSANGRNRIIVGSFDTKTEAEEQLKLAKEINKDIWILTL